MMFGYRQTGPALEFLVEGMTFVRKNDRDRSHITHAGVVCHLILPALECAINNGCSVSASEITLDARL